MLKSIYNVLKYLGISLLLMTVIYIFLLLFVPIKFNPTVDTDPNLPSIELNGHKFHSETFGDPTDQVLIVLHGGPGGDYFSMRNIKELSNKYFVIMYDQRMSGLSSRKSNIDITVQSFFDDLDSFINHYDNGKQIHIVGHSWGAMMASGYVGMHPEKVSKIVLIEPGILKAELSDPYLKATRPNIGFIDYLYLSGVWLNKWRVNLDDDKYARNDYFKSKLYTYLENKKLKNDFVGWRIGTYVQRQTIGRMMREPKLLASLDFLKGVENFNGEVLFLSSEYNSVYGAEYQERHLKYYKNVSEQIVPNSGHHIFIDQPELSNSIIDNFLSQ
jgi:proline iminopeptidase